MEKRTSFSDVFFLKVCIDKQPAPICRSRKLIHQETSCIVHDFLYLLEVPLMVGHDEQLSAGPQYAPNLLDKSGLNKSSRAMFSLRPRIGKVDMNSLEGTVVEEGRKKMRSLRAKNPDVG